MLFILIVLGLECEHEFLVANLLRLEFEVERVVCFRHNRVIHRCAFKGECFVCDSVETDRSRDLTFVLKDYLHVVVLVATGASEPEHRCAVSFKLVRFSDLQSGQSTLTSDFEAHLTLLRIQFASFDNGFEHTAILLHLSGAEEDSDVLVLIGNNLERLWLNLECETLRL